MRGEPGASGKLSCVCKRQQSQCESWRDKVQLKWRMGFWDCVSAWNMSDDCVYLSQDHWWDYGKLNQSISKVRIIKPVYISFYCLCVTYIHLLWALGTYMWCWTCVKNVAQANYSIPYWEFFVSLYCVFSECDTDAHWTPVSELGLE